MSNLSISKYSWPTVSARWFDILVSVALLLACLIWSVFSGKDQNWDQLQYHFYLPYSLLDDRLGQDFIAANGQSYLNPMAYVPFYWMVTHEWNSLVIASVLAAVHSINGVLAYFIAKKLLPSESPNWRIVAVFAAILAFLTPVFLAEVGTTYADISTSVLVLAAVLCALQSDQPAPAWRDYGMVCGLLMGVAGALKLSNLVFGPACAVLLVCMQPSLLRSARAILLLGMGSLLGFFFGHGYWGWKLWKEFHDSHESTFATLLSPNIFSRLGAANERFLPADLSDALLLPFRLVKLRSWIYTETILPDLRIAALVIVAVVGGTYLFARYRKNLDLSAIQARRFFALFLFFIVAFGLWQWTSGNGRYGLAILVLAGPLLVVTTYVVLRGNAVAYYVLSALIVAQILHFQNAAGLRFSSVPWTSSWYPMSIPEQLKHDPYLYISVGPTANSYIYPFLSKDSSFTNPIGQISLELESTGGQRLRKLMDKFKGRVRLIAAADTMIDSTGSKVDQLAQWLTMKDSLVSRLGFAVDTSSCELIRMASISEHAQQKPTDPPERLMRTCRLVERPFALAEEQARMTKILKEVVEWCPKLFKPSYTVIDRIPAGWQASYPSTDSLLIIIDQKIVGLQTGAWADFMFGTVTQWEQGIRPACSSFPDNPRKVYKFE